MGAEQNPLCVWFLISLEHHTLSSDLSLNVQKEAWEEFIFKDNSDAIPCKLDVARAGDGSLKRPVWQPSALSSCAGCSPTSSS